MKKKTKKKEKVNKNYPIIIGVDKDLGKYHNLEWVKKSLARANEMLAKYPPPPEWD
jgi:hypothetical protein